jgi:tetratricopeptide (TPR) repeat protein
MLEQEQDFAGAIAVFEEFTSKYPEYNDLAAERQCGDYVAWAHQLNHEGEFNTAAELLKTFIVQEHDRLAPLRLPEYWPWVWPYPYAMIERPDSREPCFEGPGFQYDEASALYDINSVLGVSPDGSWYAIDRRIHVETLEILREAEFVADARVCWVPTDTVNVLVGINDVPIPGPFLETFSEESDCTAQAIDALRVAYHGLAETELAAGRYDEAATAYVALSEISPEGKRREVYQTIAQTHVQAAGVELDLNRFEQAIAQMQTAHDWDVSGRVTMEMWDTYSSRLLAAAAQAAAEERWEQAILDYETIIGLETEFFARGTLRFTEEEYAVLGKDGETEYVLLYPGEPDSQLWVTIPDPWQWLDEDPSSVPDLDNIHLPSLRSHQAFQGLTTVNLEQALAEWTQLEARGVITTILDVRYDEQSRHLMDLVPEIHGSWLRLVGQYSSTAVQQEWCDELVEILVALACDLRQSPRPGEDVGYPYCERPEIALEEWEALLADESVPRVLNQCGTDYLAQERWDQASHAFRLVIDEYPDAPESESAKRSLWVADINHRGLRDARDSVCSETVDQVQGSINSIAGPHVVSAQLIAELPTSWQGTETETNVVVCIDIDQVNVQQCPYEGGRTLIRVRKDYGVRIVDPVLRTTVARTVIQGGWPPICPSSHPFYLNQTKDWIYGPTPTHDVVLAWLQQFIRD